MNQDDTPARGGSPAAAVGAENDGRGCSPRGGPRRARSASDPRICRAMWCAMLLQEFRAEGLGAPAHRRQQFFVVVASATVLGRSCAWWTADKGFCF